MSNAALYTAYYHTHKLVVLIFLLHYAVKTILLLLNKNDALERYTKPTRIPEMIVSTLFLVTGVAMLLMGANINTLLLIKISTILAAIPLAVVGFKRKIKALAVLSFLLIVTSYGLAEMSRAQKGKVTVDTTEAAGDPLAVGKIIYQQECRNCHGDDGAAMLSGAKNLKTSVMTREQIIQILRNGKNAMPAYKNFSDEQVEGLAYYVESLRE